MCNRFLLGSVTLGLLGIFSGCSHNPEKDKQQYLKSGQRYFERSQYQEAAIQYKNAIQIDPRFAEAYFRLGLTYLELQRWQEAFSALNQTVELDPARIQAHLELGKLYLQGRFY